MRSEEAHSINSVRPAYNGSSDSLRFTRIMRQWSWLSRLTLLKGVCDDYDCSKQVVLFKKYFRRFLSITHILERDKRNNYPTTWMCFFSVVNQWVWNELFMVDRAFFYLSIKATLNWNHWVHQYVLNES